MRRLLWLILLAAFPILLIVTGVLGWQFYGELEREVVARFSGHQWEVPSKVYAEATLLYPGVNIAEINLFDQLAHLDYRPVPGVVQSSGEYH
ncbi:MAG: hypothetical protein HY268_22465, partial [Deltaproteobacteria bacterium]|nr:hypothetical protein [Deltaproteobacteria bacterium]